MGAWSPAAIMFDFGVSICSGVFPKGWRGDILLGTKVWYST